METAANAVSLFVRKLRVATPEGKELLHDISFDLPEGSFTAIIGLSGCGKSTLIKALTAQVKFQSGSVLFAGHPVLELKEAFPLAIGYISQFGVFHAELTVKEILQQAVDLRLSRSVSEDVRSAWLENIVRLAKLTSFLPQRYGTLSGGQMRRVALAEQLIGDPPFLLLDELTSGLDVLADREIMEWLQNLARSHRKTVLLVTHNTDHIDLCDQIMVLSEGRLARQGTHEEIFNHPARTVEQVLLSCCSEQIQHPSASLLSDVTPSPRPLNTGRPPDAWRQFQTLLIRQATLFVRDRAQIAIQAALIITFPLLVAVFAISGLPQVRALGLAPDQNLLRSFQDQKLLLQDSLTTASLVSGLVMFQIILLTLMGANNGAREIAREHLILKKELFSGLSPIACISSKFVQLTILSGIQAFWMGWFVRTVCGFPGEFFSQFVILFLTTLAMSTICLAISAAVTTAERASLLSIYLVGFQLPLSGAALALPAWLSSLTQPFIAAYWGWSGFLRTLQDTRYFQLVEEATKTTIASFSIVVGVLLIHILISIFAAVWLLSRSGRR